MAELPILSGPAAARAGREALHDFHATGEGGETAWDRARPALAAPEVWRAALEELRREAERHALDLHAGARAAIELFVAAVGREREAARGVLLADLRQLVARLASAPGGGCRGGLAAELGESGRAFVNADRLAELIPALPGLKTPPPERLALLGRARATLEAALAAPPGAPLTVLHAGAWPAGLALPGVEAVEVANPLVAAGPLFDERVRPAVEVLRAARRARLEVEGAFRPERHERALERFDWRAAAPGELPLLPRVVVLEEAARVRSSGLGALADLLRSGRPIHVLLIDRAHERVVDTDGPEIAWVAAALRAAHVLQSTLARPQHLAAGLERLAGSPLPALALVAVPSTGEPSPEIELLAAHAAHATPCFHFDPRSGDTWAACLALETDAAPAGPWPIHEVSHAGADGARQGRYEAFTPAHAAALAPGGARHFRTIPADAPGVDPVEIADYLALPESARRGKLPCIWLTDSEGRPLRAVTTRAVIAACRERLATWRTLLELASVRGAAAEPEAAREPGAVATDAAPVTPTAGPAAADGTREREAAIARLLHALLGIEGAEIAPSPAPAPPSAVVAQLAAARASMGPRIDTPLCTSCNECTNLNPRMFRYDANKQAYVADASAGTYAELVKAAEKCPARCIHPGTPRNGDRTATDKFLARAARFN